MTNKKRIKELRDKSDAELRAELGRLREEFFLRKFTADPKRIQNPGKYQQMRKTIARLLTVLQERDAATAKK